MIKKLSSYFSLLCLMGCLTNSGNDNVRATISSSNKNTNTQNTSDDTRNNTTSKSTLSNLSKIDSLKNSIETENKSRIRTAINSYNSEVADKNNQISNTTTNINLAIELLKEGKIPEKINAITNIKSIYDTYKQNTTDYNSLNYVLKTSSNFDNTTKYAEYLEENTDKTIIGNITRASYETTDDKTADEQYISAVESAYFNKIKLLSNFDKRSDYTDKTYTSENYVSIMTALNTQVSSLKTTITSNETTIITNLKVLDSSITEIPLTLNNLVSNYEKQLKILTAIKDVKCIENPTITPSGAITGKGIDSTVAYEYNDALNDYTLKLTPTSTTPVSFQASDFTLNSTIKTYTASKELDSKIDTDYKNYAESLQKYLLAGGSSTSEQNQRRLYAKELLEKVKKGTATTQEKEQFTEWTGISEYNNIKIESSAEYKKYTIIYALLSDTKNTPDFTIDKITKTTDTVYLGGQYNNLLSFSDFGLLNRTTTISYDGSKIIITPLINDNVISETTTTNSYGFYSGIDSLAQKIVADITKAGQTSVFSGNTIAYATLTGKTEDSKKLANDENLLLSGTAKLVAKLDTGKGDLSLNFDKWYSFKFSDIDLTTGTISHSNTPTLETSPSSKNVWFQKPAEGDAVFTGSVYGQMYGMEENSPSEVVGSYIIQSSSVDTTKYTNAKITGAFGAKK